MKDSKDWIRQPMVDEAADAFVATGEYGVSDVTAYQVGKTLGCEANGSLHAKVRDWRRRRQDDAVTSAIEVPPEAEAEFGGVLDRMTGQAKTVFRRTIQQVGSEFERSMMPRVVDAERRRDVAEAETDKVLELWQKTEADLSDALLKIGELEQAAAEARFREERLIGRLEQRASDWATTLRYGHRDAELPEPNHRRDGTKPPTAETAIGSVAGESSSGRSPMRTSARPAGPRKSRRNLRAVGGKFGAFAGCMLASFLEETSMTYRIVPPYAEPFNEHLSRLDSLIADARADLAAAEAAVDAASAVIEAIEPHFHAHGYTAGEDCAYAGVAPEHFLPLAGLLAQPWRAALDVIVTAQRKQDLDYLLKAFPTAIADIGDTLIADGAELLDARSDRVEQNLPELFERRPIVALGLIWRLFGFHRRDRDSWVGIFAYRSDLSALIGSTVVIPEDTMLGDALAAAVTACRPLLGEVGREEFRRRAAMRDAERQASWAEVPEAYRERGSWRGWAPTKGQRHLMQRIEAARCLPIAATGRRGDASDWITGAGGNPRFNHANEEQA